MGHATENKASESILGILSIHVVSNYPQSVVFTYVTAMQMACLILAAFGKHNTSQAHTHFGAAQWPITIGHTPSEEQQ